MTREREKRVERLFRPEKLIITREHAFVRVKSIVYFFAKGGKSFAVDDSGKKHPITQNLNTLQKAFGSSFLQVHRSFLVAVDRITGIFNRFPKEEEEPAGELAIEGLRRMSVFDIGRGVEDECELALKGTKKRIPVTVTYAGNVKLAFRLKSLHHLVPEHPDDKKLRLYELIDFGWRELYDLDPKDQAAVDAFKARWDIKQFTRVRMLTYFRQVQVNRIDKRRVIKNIIYQMFRWIKKGIEPLSDGNIRSLWYRIKAVLAYHSNILEPGDVDTFYNTLQEMVEDKNLFRYKDFGFMDMNEPYRGIGTERPEIILASEKIGHYLFIRKLAAEVGASFICLKGEPAIISLEYFSDELFEACGDRNKTVFSISDIDPAGYSIERNLLGGLERQGHKIARVVKLVDPSVFTTEEISIIRYPVVGFQQKGDTITPQPPARMSQVTKSRDWFSQEIKDDRFLSEKDKGGGWKVVTIWGIESDAADRAIIQKRFLDGLSQEERRSREKPLKRR